MLGWRAGNA